MPLRRVSPEPSPRLRALLETVDARVRAGAAEAAEEPAGVEAPRGLEAAAGVEPWLPQRSWVMAAPDSAAGVQTGVGTAPGVTGAARGRHRRPSPPPPRLLTLPSSLRNARVRAPRAATIGLILVVVLTAAGFGVRVAWAKAASAPRPIAAGATGSAITTGGPRGRFESPPTNAGATATSGGTATPGGTATSGSAGVTVHVVGQVLKPGLVRLPAGSRVADAVAKAGGARPDADLAAINLARVVADGEQLRVPKPGEV
ncbi:MAG TPA: SLBB domain-containing protein, partial [Pedococcus sp.]|nr:SLBB domain-containing protein [Pedococcus sp.]